jgi:ABC-2 type transport system ATP-binding protein
MISFHRLRKDYGAFIALRDLTLDIGRGEVFGFLGPNGAGKTTTIRIMMGILVPTSGRVAIDGLDCQRDRVEVKRRVGYLPDNPMFYDYLRGREILIFVGEMHGLTTAKRKCALTGCCVICGSRMLPRTMR